MKQSKNTTSVLIPDAATFAFPYILNCFSHIKDTRLYIMSTKQEFPLRYSRHVYKFLYYPEQSNELEWIALINNVTEEYGIDIIMPIYEIGIKIIIEHKAFLNQNINKLVPLSSFQDFKTASNKALLAEHLTKVGLPGPKTVPLSLAILEEKDGLHLKFPVLAKPLKSGSGRGISKFESHDDLAAYFENKGLNEPYILQEYIEGPIYCCNVMCREGEIVAYTIQRGNLWSSKPFSPQIGLDFVYDDDLFETVKKLMKTLNWNGVANIDLIFDSKNKVFHILEINPRYWSSLTASLMAGINFPQLQLSLFKKEKIEPQNYKQMGYVVLVGLKQTLKKEKTLLAKARFIWESTPMKYRFDDPVPIAYEYFQEIKKDVTEKIGRLFPVKSAES